MVMTEHPGAASRPRQAAGYAALALAVVLALGAGVFFYLRGEEGGDAGSGPAPAGTLGPLVPDRPEIGKPAPDFALADARDPSVIRKLSDFRGKVVLLNWYASWCDPCKREIPAFVRAQEALGDRLVILGVDYREPPEQAVGILDELGANYPALLDSEGAVGTHYRLTGMPTTFLIGADGTLLAMRAGELREEQLAAFLAQAGLEYTPE